GGIDPALLRQLGELPQDPVILEIAKDVLTRETSSYILKHEALVVLGKYPAAQTVKELAQFLAKCPPEDSTAQMVLPLGSDARQLILKCLDKDTKAVTSIIGIEKDLEVKRKLMELVVLKIVDNADCMNSFQTWIQSSDTATRSVIAKAFTESFTFFHG